MRFKLEIHIFDSENNDWDSQKKEFVPKPSAHPTVDKEFELAVSNDYVSRFRENILKTVDDMVYLSLAEYNHLPTAEVDPHGNEVRAEGLPPANSKSQALDDEVPF